MESEINYIELVVPVRVVRQNSQQHQTVRRYLQACGLTNEEILSVLQIAKIFPPGGVQVIKNLYDRSRLDYHIRMI